MKSVKKRWDAEKLKKTLAFDQYGRYAKVRDLINLNRKKDQVFSILDVGGRGNLLREFLPKDSVWYLDPFVDEKDENYVAGDGCDMPLEDEQFDFVVSLDVFEHIPEDKREKFLKEKIRVARMGVILLAPFYSEEVAFVEREANHNFKILSGGGDHKWLIEHIENGLPKEKMVEDFLKKQNLDFDKFNNNNLFLWSICINVVLSAIDFNLEESSDMLRDFNHFYNEKVYPSDSTEFSYRKGYLIKKESGLKMGKIIPEDKKDLLEVVSRAFKVVNTIEKSKIDKIIAKEVLINQLEEKLLNQEKNSKEQIEYRNQLALDLEDLIQKEKKNAKDQIEYRDKLIEELELQLDSEKNNAKEQIDFREKLVYDLDAILTHEKVNNRDQIEYRDKLIEEIKNQLSLEKNNAKEQIEYRDELVSKLEELLKKEKANTHDQVEYRDKLIEDVKGQLGLEKKNAKVQIEYRDELVSNLEELLKKEKANAHDQVEYRDKLIEDVKGQLGLEKKNAKAQIEYRDELVSKLEELLKKEKANTHDQVEYRDKLIEDVKGQLGLEKKNAKVQIEYRDELVSKLEELLKKEKANAHDQVEHRDKINEILKKENEELKRFKKITEEAWFYRLIRFKYEK